jgi:hypothetical protein
MLYKFKARSDVVRVEQKYELRFRHDRSFVKIKMKTKRTIQTNGSGVELMVCSEQTKLQARTTRDMTSFGLKLHNLHLVGALRKKIGNIPLLQMLLQDTVGGEMMCVVNGHP